MGRLRLVAIALTALAVSGLLVSSAGFSTVAAERGVTVSVVADDDAYIGYQTIDRNVSDGARIPLVTISNRLFGPVSVTDVTVDSNVTFSDVSTPTLDPGEQATIDGTVACENGTTETVEITVMLEGDGVMATIYGDTITREFDVECNGS